MLAVTTNGLLATGVLTQKFLSTDVINSGLQCKLIQVCMQALYLGSRTRARSDKQAFDKHEKLHY